MVCKDTDTTFSCRSVCGYFTVKVHCYESRTVPSQSHLLVCVAACNVFASLAVMRAGFTVFVSLAVMRAGFTVPCT